MQSRCFRSHHSRPSNTTRENQTQRQEYIELALACLRGSIAVGYNDFDQMQQDPDLAVLYGLREFEELLQTPPHHRWRNNVQICFGVDH